MKRTVAKACLRSPFGGKIPEQNKPEKSNSEISPVYGRPCGQARKRKNQKTAETQCFSGLSHRSDWIRTSGLLVPKGHRSHFLFIYKGFKRFPARFRAGIPLFQAVIRPLQTLRRSGPRFLFSEYGQTCGQCFCHLSPIRELGYGICSSGRMKQRTGYPNPFPVKICVAKQ